MHSERSPLVIALSGGIASGKSAVEQRFAALGIATVDADVASRHVVAPGTDGLASIVAAFGADVLNPQRTLDRAAMRQRIFVDPAARRTLENIVHPRVRQRMIDQVRITTGPYVVLVIPLLAENIGHYRWVDRILVVDVPETTQIRRLVERDGIDEALATRILASQASRESRLALADDVIDNDGPEAALDAQVLALHRNYLALAAARR
jgi:dephospho-CoA kinase